MAMRISPQRPTTSNTAQFGQPREHAHSLPDDSSIAAAVGAVLADGSDGWSIQRDGIWYVAQPIGRPLREQGWKLHMSATPLSMLELVARAVPVLAAGRCAFKYPAGMDVVRWLTSSRCPRPAAGKCLTAYPADDDEFRRLAARLDRVTTGLPGPQILSDRPYRPGSVVHY